MNAGNAWINSQNGAESKLKYAIERVMKRTKKVIEQYREDLEDAQIEHCYADEKGVIVRDGRGEYQFTKEGLTALNQKRRELVRSEVSVEPYFATELPENLDPTTKEIFTGFVIKESGEEGKEESENE